MREKSIYTSEAVQKYGLDQQKFDLYLRSSPKYSRLITEFPDGVIKLGVNQMEKAVRDFNLFQSPDYVTLNDLIHKYNIPKEKIERFVKEKHIVTVEFEDNYCIARAVIENYFPEETERYRRGLQARKEKPGRLSSMLITSGFSFDGYTITRYSGYISGEGVAMLSRLQIAKGGADMQRAMTSCLAEIRRQAIANLKESAYVLGCNAVIGVDFDYLTLDTEANNAAGGTAYQPYVLAAIANGNAVVIEKEKGKSGGQ